jgi:hypothetical protein
MRVSVDTIYVYLPEEAVECWYPVCAEHTDGDRYRILDEARRIRF